MAVPWRVWKSDGRYRIVVCENERQALRKVRHGVRVERAYDRAHPAERNVG